MIFISSSSKETLVQNRVSRLESRGLGGFHWYTSSSTSSRWTTEGRPVDYDNCAEIKIVAPYETLMWDT